MFEKQDMTLEVEVTNQNDSNECIICLGNVQRKGSRSRDCDDFTTRHKSPYKDLDGVLSRALGIDPGFWRSLDPWVSSNCFCTTCEEWLGQIHQTFEELDALQNTLKTFQNGLETKILKSCEVIATRQNQSAFDRSHPHHIINSISIASEIRRLRVSQNRDDSPKDDDDDGILIKEELMLPHEKFDEEFHPGVEFEHVDLDPEGGDVHFNDYDNIESNAALTLTNTYGTDTNDGLLLNQFGLDKELFIRIPRADTIYPDLKHKSSICASTENLFFDFIPGTRAPTSQMRTRSGRVRLEPTDPFDVKLYQLPTRCSVSDCTSTVIYRSRSRLNRHIQNVHILPSTTRVKVILDPYDHLSYTLPSKCRIPRCQNPFIYKGRLKLQNHIENKHLRERKDDPFDHFNYPTDCSIPGCNTPRTFPNKSLHRKHLRRNHGITNIISIKDLGDPSGKEKCPICEALIRPENLKNHLEFHYSKPPSELGDDGPGSGTPPQNPLDIKQYVLPSPCFVLGCSQENVYTDRNYLSRHLLHMHKFKKLPKSVVDQKMSKYTHFPASCLEAHCKSKKMFGKNQLRMHLKISHRKPPDPLDALEFPTKCPEMDCTSQTVFNFKNTLRNHLAAVHKKAEFGFGTKGPRFRKHQCEDCGALLLGSSSLRVHRRLHTGEFLTCEFCGLQVRSESWLKTHKETHHSEVPKVYACTLCPKTFKIKRSLDYHIMRHTGEKKLNCSLCPLTFIFKFELDNHSRFIHGQELGLEQYKCEHCSKVYSKKYVLREHVKSHLENAQFKYNCHECGYKTDRKVDYNEHVATVHVKDFPFQCSLCDKKFKLKRRLSEHALTHQNTCAKCPVCHRRCLSEKSLKIHWSKRHPEDFREKWKDYKEQCIGNVSEDRHMLPVELLNLGAQRIDSGGNIGQSSQS